MLRRVKLSWIHFFAPEEVGLSSLWVLLQLPAASTLYLSFHVDPGIYCTESFPIEHYFVCHEEVAN